MRHLFPAVLLLLLAACGGTPRPSTVTAPPVATAPPQRGALIGADAAALASRFGKPRLQIREGDGTKLQFAGATCLLDAYLYPSGGNGVPRVTHIDTRSREGRPVAQADCVAMIERR